MRLRKSLKITNGNKKYTKKELSPAMITSDRHLLIPLYQSERAWAYAMQMKDEAGPDGLPPRVYFHLVRRYAKATHWCKQLQLLAAEKVDDKTTWEIEAYSSWMNGNFLLEKEIWSESVDAFVKARTIYEKMSKLGDPEEQELYKERVIEIDTSLRYCNFNLHNGNVDDIKKLIEITHSQSGGSYDLLNSKLEAALQESRRNQAASMEKISWRGRSVPIKSDKIRLSLISAEEIRTQISAYNKDNMDEKLSLYSQLFMNYGDSLEIIRKELKVVKDANRNEKQKSSKAEFEESNLSFLLKYVSYLKLTKTIERNLSLAEYLQNNLNESALEGKRIKPDEIVRIYENLIQNYTELQEFAENEDLETTKLNVAKSLSCRAFRCFYLALSYRNNYEWANAVALLDKSLSHIQVAKTHHLDCQRREETDIAQLDKLISRVQGEKCVAKAKAYLKSIETSNGNEVVHTEGTLADHLNEYNTAYAQTKQLANFPPEFVPIANKPVLFDLANATLEFPDLEARKQKKGFFRGWW